MPTKGNKDENRPNTAPPPRSSRNVNKGNESEAQIRGFYGSSSSAVTHIGRYELVKRPREDESTDSSTRDPRVGRGPALTPLVSDHQFASVQREAYSPPASGRPNGPHDWNAANHSPELTKKKPDDHPDKAAPAPNEDVSLEFIDVRKKAFEEEEERRKKAFEEKEQRRKRAFEEEERNRQKQQEEGRAERKRRQVQEIEHELDREISQKKQKLDEAHERGLAELRRW